MEMLGGGVVGGPSAGPYGRFGIGGGAAAIGLGNRESLRDVVTRGGAGGHEDFASVYAHRVAIGVRREDESSPASRTGGGGGSFVAYAPGGNEVARSLHSAGRGVEDEHAGIPSIPILTTRHSDRNDHDGGRGSEGEIQVWQGSRGSSRDLRDEESKEKAMASQMRVMEISSNEAKGDDEKAENDNSIMQHKARGSAGLQPNNIINSGSSGSSTCQDCGNQAKKDCSHMRCRTCCKSRGFDCSTHVKSTWVPAARRRERQQAEAAAIAAGHPRPKTKRSRFITATATTPSHTSTSTGSPPRSSDIYSTHQDLNFKASLPAEVRAQAVFKCVRVTSMDDGEDEYAYQASVKIGGHIFKGVLHDKGLDTANGPSILPDLHLGERSTHVASTSSMIDSAAVYGASGSALLGALQ